MCWRVAIQRGSWPCVLCCRPRMVSHATNFSALALHALALSHRLSHRCHLTNLPAVGDTHPLAHTSCPPAAVHTTAHLCRRLHHVLKADDRVEAVADAQQRQAALRVPPVGIREDVLGKRDGVQQRAQRGVGLQRMQGGAWGGRSSWWGACNMGTADGRRAAHPLCRRTAGVNASKPPTHLQVLLVRQRAVHRGMPVIVVNLVPGGAQGGRAEGTSAQRAGSACWVSTRRSTVFAPGRISSPPFEAHVGTFPPPHRRHAPAGHQPRQRGAVVEVQVGALLRHLVGGHAQPLSHVVWGEGGGEKKQGHSECQPLQAEVGRASVWQHEPGAAARMLSFNPKEAAACDPARRSLTSDVLCHVVLPACGTEEGSVRRGRACREGGLTIKRPRMATKAGWSLLHLRLPTLTWWCSRTHSHPAAKAGG